MAEYIYVNKAGIELRREPKGRGRVKTNANLREDGNFYIVQESTIVEQPVITPEVVPSTDTPSADFSASEQIVPPFVKKSKNNKDIDENIIEVRKEELKIPLQTFIDSMYYSPQDYEKKDDKILMYRCVQQFNIGMTGFKFNAPYACVEVCLKTGTISVWITYYRNKPDFIVNNCIILDEQKIETPQVVIEEPKAQEILA